MNKKKTFNKLLIAQSLSAFGDNAVYSVIMGTLLLTVNSGQKTLLQFGVDSAIYANCLFLPYVMIAPGLGWFSDYFPKKKILIVGNTIKAAGCLLGLVGIMTGNGLMMLSYIMIGIGAAVYSPAKYGIIPELKEKEELVRANAAIEMTTIFSILLGIVGGGILVDNLGGHISYLILTLIYVLATLFNASMDDSNLCHKRETLPEAVSEFGNTLRSTLQKRQLSIALLGTTIFWFSASFVKLIVTNVSFSLDYFLSKKLKLGGFIGYRLAEFDAIKTENGEAFPVIIDFSGLELGIQAGYLF